MNKNADFDVALIGMGTFAVEQLTLEAVEVLTKCASGYVVAHTEQAIAAFRSDLEGRIKTTCSIPPLYSLSAQYEIDRQRLLNYEAAAEYVLDQVSTRQPIAFLTPGHPFVLDSVASLIVQGAERRGHRIRAVSGISSVDSLLTELMCDLAPGLIAIDATYAMENKVRIDTRLSCVLLQASVLGSNLPTTERETSSKAWSELQSHLLEYYPPQHTISAVRTPLNSSEAVMLRRCELRRLAESAFDFPEGCSLFIPSTLN